MQTLSDGELVEKACGGDARAFAALAERHYDLMFCIAFKWCRNRADAEDIAQDSCLKLARAIRSFSGRAAFTSWLYRLVINTAIDWQRANRREDTGALDNSESDHAGVTAPEAEERLMAQDMLRQIDALPAKEKAALLLVVAEGMNHAEAAIIMEVKESTVSWYIHEARKKLGIKSENKRSAGHG
jgi:RNA polymerase sigma factor (sigma-70 family)